MQKPYIIVIGMAMMMLMIYTYYRQRQQRLQWILIQNHLISDCFQYHQQFAKRLLRMEKDECVERFVCTIDVAEIKQICDQLQHWLGKHISRPVYLAPVPIQYRQYRPGSFMATHQDHGPFIDITVVAKQQSGYLSQVVSKHTRQYEVVVVLYDNSDAYFYYLIDNTPIFVKTKPGDVIVVQHGGILHGVTKSTHGVRSILKLAFHDGHGSAT